MRLAGTDQDREVLRHLPLLHRLDADPLERLGEPRHLGRAVQFPTMRQAASPGKDRGDRIGGGGLALLVLAVVPRHRAVGRLRLHGLPVGRHQHAGHQAKRAEALRHDVALHVAVVVLAGPDVAPLPLQRAGHHVVDQAVLVGDPLGIKLRLELGVEDLLEDVFEAAVVDLEDRVLRGEIHGIAPSQAVAKTRPGEVADGVVEVVHRHRDARRRKLEDLHLHRLPAVGRREGERERTLARDLQVGRPVLVAKRMAAHHDRLRPAGDESGNVLDDDRLAKDHAAKDVADRAIGALPHALEVELLDPGLIGRDRGTLHSHAAFPNGVGRVDRHLVGGGVAVFDREVVGADVEVEVGQDQLVLDVLPDDPRHLVAVEIDDRALDLDLSCHHRAPA